MISIKSKSEIELMKKSGYVVAIVFEQVEKAIRPGISTLEIDGIVEKLIRSHGAIPSFKGYKGLPGSMDYPGSICASINNEVVHGLPSLRTLKDGDIISVDIGVCLNGFHADAARTFPVGNISGTAAQLIRVTEQSFYEGIGKALKGNRIVDISIAIQEYVESFGFSVIREYVGHGVGRHLQEAPQIPNYRTREKGPRLEAGMTLAIEPMVNEGDYCVKLLDNKWTVVTADGSLSAHYENTIAVTGGGPIVLTKLD